jgi:hypothetical protein
MTHPTVTDALDAMLAHHEVPYEAAPSVALAYETAARLDACESVDSYTPLANSLHRQLVALRTWITPPPVIEEDPFDALARRLGAGVGHESSG